MPSQQELNSMANAVRDNLRAMCRTSSDDPSHEHMEHASLQFAHRIMHSIWSIREYGDVADNVTSDERIALYGQLVVARDLTGLLVEQGVHLPVPLVHQIIVAASSWFKRDMANSQAVDKP